MAESNPLFEGDLWDKIEGTAIGLIHSMVSGVLLYLAFPPFGLWFLMWIALLPMFYAQYHLMPKKLAFLAPTFAMLVFWGLAFARIEMGFSVPWHASKLPLAFILASKDRLLGVVCITVALLTTLQRGIHQLSGRGFLIWEPCLFWVGLEVSRDLIPFIGTSYGFGYSQFNVLPVARVASLLGVYGVSALLVMANASLLACFLSLSRDDRSVLRYGPIGSPTRKALLRDGRLGVALVIGCLVLANIGSATGFLMPGQTHPETAVTVAAIQPGTTGELSEEMFFHLTMEAVDRGARIIVWPEASFRGDPRPMSLFSEIQNLARKAGAYLVIPYIDQFKRTEDNESAGPLFINEAILISPEGQVLGTSPKDHPVTILGETSLTRGRYPAFETPYGKIGIMICYDLNFTDTAQKLGREGANIILVPSNDWLHVSQQQRTFAVMRALETGAFVVKADSQYDSAIVSPKGEILASTISSKPRTMVLVKEVTLLEKRPLALYVARPFGLCAIILWILLRVFPGAVRKILLR